MSDPNSSAANPPAVPSQQMEQLKQIYDYAKFHIGLYATVNTALVAIASFSFKDNQLLLPYRWCFFIIFLFFLLAGVGGGLVASHIAYSKWEPAQVNKLLDGFTQPTVSNPFKWSQYKLFTVIEHYAFWAGVVFGLVVLMLVWAGAA
jgi:hypothetical protein